MKADIFEQKEFKVGEKGKYKIVVQQKRIGQEYKLDIRFWLKKEGFDEYYPLKIGICATNQVFRDQIIPALNEFALKYV